MIWTIKLILIVGATAAYAESKSVREDTSLSNETRNTSTVEVAAGVKFSPAAINQLDKPAHNDLTSTPVAPSPNVTTANVTQIAYSNSTSLNSTSSTSSTSTTTTTTTTAVPPPKILINYDFSKTIAAVVNNTNATITEKIIPVNEFEIGEKNDNKMSVAKKGFQVNETGEVLSSSSTTSTTTTTQRPKKPTVTIGNEDTVDTISNDAIRVNSNTNMSLHPVSKKTDYIVPIVGVILSVPLVAILMNLVYRKTKDWWQYRHYKRMDLIDGIYNN